MLVWQLHAPLLVSIDFYGLAVRRPAFVSASVFTTAVYKGVDAAAADATPRTFENKSGCMPREN